MGVFAHCLELHGYTGVDFYVKLYEIADLTFLRAKSL